MNFTRVWSWTLTEVISEHSIQQRDAGNFSYVNNFVTSGKGSRKLGHCRKFEKTSVVYLKDKLGAMSSCLLQSAAALANVHRSVGDQGTDFS